MRGCVQDRASLSWDAQVDPEATIRLTGRTARSLEAPAFAADVPLAVLPQDAPPVDLWDRFPSLQGYLQIDASLEVAGAAPSPTLRSLTLTSYCPCGL